MCVEEIRGEKEIEVVGLMQYKDYLWENNPEKIEIIQMKNIKDLIIPDVGDIIQDMGLKARVVRGDGIFFKEGRFESFVRLSEVFKEQTSGELIVPGFVPMKAFFVSLKLEGSTAKYLRYSFEFKEESRRTEINEVMERKYYEVLENESLWQIARKTRIDVAVLVGLNPEISDPNIIKRGQIVWLK
jgi:LysM repeat protein